MAPRVTLVACFAAFAAGCTASGGAGQVQEAGSGTYTVSVGHTLGGVSQNTGELNTAVDKAGEYCHSKGQKLQVMTAADKAITFRCVSGDVQPPVDHPAR
jgi:hypothetical protein